MKEILNVLDSGFERIDSVREESAEGFVELSRRPDDERIVLEVMRELEHYFSKRGITFISKQRELLQAAVEQMLNRERERPIVIPLLPGMGKSTLIRCMNFLEEPTGGEIYIDGVLLTKKNLKAFGALRGTNEKRRLLDIVPDMANPNTGIIRDGGVVIPYTISADVTD